MYEGIKNIEEALLFYSGNLRFVGVVDAGATNLVIPIKDESFKTGLFNRCIIRMLSGSAKGEWKEVSTTLGNDLTLANALSVAPAENDSIAIYNFNNSALQDITIAYREHYLQTVANNIDISGGVVGTTDNFSRWTIYISAAAAIDITVELSPDGGVTYYEITESPLIFAAAGDMVLEVGYDSTNIRFTGSNVNLVTIQLRGLY